MSVEGKEMRTGKGSQEDEEYEEEECGSNKRGLSSNQTVAVNANNNNSTNKDGKNRLTLYDQNTLSRSRGRGVRSMKDLITNTDQKRDRASFLLEVIEYVRYLQEKIQKYEGSSQGWSSGPKKLMPWRNSHWRVQSLAGHRQAIKSGSGPGSTAIRTFDENNINIYPTMITSAQNAIETDPIRVATSKTMDRQSELANKGMPLPIEGENVLLHPLQRPVSEAQSTECLISDDTLNQQEDLTIGGTISISSVYSQGLLNSLAQPVQSTGLDLSQANISVWIDLVKHANGGLTLAKAMTHRREVSSGENSDPARKRLKI